MLFERMRRLASAIAGNAVTELEAAHPAAVLDAERTRLRLQVARYNRGLAAHAAIAERRCGSSRCGRTARAGPRGRGGTRAHRGDEAQHRRGAGAARARGAV
jgi:hypothetical protein